MRKLLTSLLIFALSLWIPNQVSLAQAREYTLQPGEALHVPVAPLQQLKLTSCGEAVLAMAYQYAYPQTDLDEQQITVYAEMQGYYTETKFPFTSPANMVALTRHYTRNFASGTASASAEGLALLSAELHKGHPVIIDILARLDDPRSGAHFVLVTGLSVAPGNPSAILVYYNDPLTGKAKSSPWYGEEGLWNAWHNNGDPGGSGWWLAIQVAPPVENTPY